MISAFTRIPRRTYSTANERVANPPLGPWFAPLRSDDRRDRGCSNGSRTGAGDATRSRPRQQLPQYLAANLASSGTNHRAVAGMALTHGYDTTFRWTAGILVAGSLIGGNVLRGGPLVPAAQQALADDKVGTAEVGLDPSPAG